jgi:hypothetical protein
VSPPDAPNVVPASVNPSSHDGAAEAVTVAVDTPTPGDTVKSEEPKDEPQSESQPSSKDHVTPNGGTDLSDGNQAKPDTAGGGSTHRDDGGSATVTEEEPDSTCPSGESAGTATGDTGSDEGSGADGESPKG